MAKSILNPLEIKNTVLGMGIIRRAESQLEVDYLFSELWKARHKADFNAGNFDRSMYWSSTPQGYEFWNDLQERYFGWD